MERILVVNSLKQQHKQYGPGRFEHEQFVENKERQFFKCTIGEAVLLFQKCVMIAP